MSSMPTLLPSVARAFALIVNNTSSTGSGAAADGSGLLVGLAGALAGGAPGVGAAAHPVRSSASTPNAQPKGSAPRIRTSTAVPRYGSRVAPAAAFTTNVSG